MAWTIYAKDGKTVRCTVHELEYHGEFMGECYISFDTKSEEPIDFEFGDYLTYRGEEYTLNYDPSVIKKAAKYKVGDGFTYEGVKLNSYADELTRCMFLDYVKNDNEIHYTSLPTFSFYCETVETLAERIQANLNRLYLDEEGKPLWTVEVYPYFDGKKNQSVSVNSITVWDALALANTTFDANFVVRGRTITIGTDGSDLKEKNGAADFTYGKGNGLTQVERTADSDQAIITRLRAYGDTRNMARDYYQRYLFTDGLPFNLDCGSMINADKSEYGLTVDITHVYQDDTNESRCMAIKPTTTELYRCSWGEISGVPCLDHEKEVTINVRVVIHGTATLKTDFSGLSPTVKMNIVAINYNEDFTGNPEITEIDYPNQDASYGVAADGGNFYKDGQNQGNFYYEAQEEGTLTLTRDKSIIALQYGLYPDGYSRTATTIEISAFSQMQNTENYITINSDDTYYLKLYLPDMSSTTINDIFDATIRARVAGVGEVKLTRPGVNDFPTFTTDDGGMQKIDVSPDETTYDHNIIEFTSGVDMEKLYDICTLSGSAYDNLITAPCIPESMIILRLMLPGFSYGYTDSEGNRHEGQTDVYLDSENIEELGIREGTVFFDGSSEDLDDIYPSIEGMTMDDLNAAGYEVTMPQDANNPGGYLDVIYEGSAVYDSGVFEDGQTVNSFTVSIYDIGFNINDYLTTETAMLCMKDGMCGGREFDIVRCVAKTSSNGATYYELSLNRVQDTDIDLYFPMSGYNIAAGDKFVITGITMPDVYVKAAQQRLLLAAEEYLAKYDYVRYTYTPQVDNLYMARQEDGLIDKTESLHYLIKEGDLFPFNDKDLGIDGASIPIDTLTIKEGGIIPEYEITLREEKVAGALEKMYDDITSIIYKTNNGYSTTTSSSSAVSNIIVENFDNFPNRGATNAIYIASDKNYTMYVYKSTGEYALSANPILLEEYAANFGDYVPTLGEIFGYGTRTPYLYIGDGERTATAFFTPSSEDVTYAQAHRLVTYQEFYDFLRDNTIVAGDGIYVDEVFPSDESSLEAFQVSVNLASDEQILGFDEDSEGSCLGATVGMRRVPKTSGGEPDMRGEVTINDSYIDTFLVLTGKDKNGEPLGTVPLASTTVSLDFTGSNSTVLNIWLRDVLGVNLSASVDMASDGPLGNYLPLTGGVLTGPLYFQTEGTTVAYIDAGTGNFVSVVTGGPATIGGALTVTGGTTLADLTVRGNAGVDYLISASGLTVTEGATVLNDTLTVAGMATLNGGLTLNSDLTIGRNYKLLFGTSGDLYITSEGEASLTTVVATTATIGGATTINGTLTVGSSGSANGNTTIHGNLNVREDTTLGFTEIEDLTVTGDATINDTLTVAGMATLNGGLTLNSDLTIGRNYKLLFGTSGDLYITSEGEASLSTVAATTATIGGPTTINGTLTVGREGAFNGNTTIHGNLNVREDTTLGFTEIEDLTVTGDATINDTLTVSSYVYGSNFYATSDERKKSDIQKITDDAVERASKVEAREYDLDGRRYGYVAQDVRRVLPSLVSEGEDGYLSLDYLSLLTLKNEALERRVQTLENQISALAARLEKMEGRDA